MKRQSYVEQNLARRKQMRSQTQKYNDLKGRAAIEEFALNLTFEVIYAHKPHCRGRKPLKKVKALFEEATKGNIGYPDDMTELQYALFAVIRGKNNVDILPFIKEYVERRTFPA